MDMCYSSEIGVDGLGVDHDLVLKILESFEGGFTTYWSEFCLLEEGVLVVDRAFHGE